MLSTVIVLLYLGSPNCLFLHTTSHCILLIITLYSEKREETKPLKYLKISYQRIHIVGCRIPSTVNAMQ